MNKLLETHTRKQISQICGVSYKTVYNWLTKKTIPYWAIEKLGFKLDKR